MTDPRDVALRQALEALKHAAARSETDEDDVIYQVAIAAIRAALDAPQESATLGAALDQAQNMTRHGHLVDAPQGEPVAWMHVPSRLVHLDMPPLAGADEYMPLYATPPRHRACCCCGHRKGDAMSGLVQRLRAPWQKWPDSPPPAICREAADELERAQRDIEGLLSSVAALDADNEHLRAEVKALREALQSIVRAAQCHNAHHAMSVDGQMLYDIAVSQLNAICAQPPSSGQ